MVDFRRISLAVAAACTAAVLTAPAAHAGGNVTMTINKGVMKLNGDGGDNSIIIEGTMSPTIFQVSSGDGTTTINGMAGPIMTGIVNRHVYIRTGLGNDTIDIRNATFTRKLKITADDGDMLVRMENVIVNFNLFIKTGDGSNEIDMVNVDIGELSNIKTGDGDDIVYWDDVVFRGGLNTKDGSDDITIVNSSHVDPKGKLIVKSGNDDDFIDVTNANWEGRLFIIAGKGNDDVTVGTIDVGVKTRVYGGPDSDTLHNNGGHVGTVEFFQFEM